MADDIGWEVFASENGQRCSVEMGSTSDGLRVPDHVTVMSGESLLIGGDKDDMVSNRNNYDIDDLPPEAAHLREGAIVVIEPIDGIPPSVTVIPALPLFDRDECARVVFEGWPEVARDWPDRHRLSNWPPSSAIVRGGFHMVPVGVSTDPEKRKLEWRYSFINGGTAS
ncbi:hypothetical protein NP493_60g05102 [Ridgeia piscesae]|uniref:Uncharacterized protein n=1 Tax=Ridgeia piscesae TaxID=27915 RepID=A0AAD9PA97_RIDPI|nr:hypothetical protein NP493_60g05102 [Ridgeia piscesae]